MTRAEGRRLWVLSVGMALAMAFVIVAVAGCAPAPVSVGSVPAEQRTVWQAENDFNAALDIALAYEALPNADPAVEAKIAVAAKAARAALYDAEALSRAGSSSAQITVALGAAQAAVAAFQAAVPAKGS